MGATLFSQGALARPWAVLYNAFGVRRRFSTEHSRPLYSSAHRSRLTKTPFAIPKESNMRPDVVFRPLRVYDKLSLCETARQARRCVSRPLDDARKGTNMPAKRSPSAFPRKQRRHQRMAVECKRHRRMIQRRLNDARRHVVISRKGAEETVSGTGLASPCGGPESKPRPRDGRETHRRSKLRTAPGDAPVLPVGQCPSGVRALRHTVPLTS